MPPAATHSGHDVGWTAMVGRSRGTNRSVMARFTPVPLPAPALLLLGAAAALAMVRQSR
jgi:hypothetical protein